MKIRIIENQLCDRSHTYDVVLVDGDQTVRFHAESCTAAIALANELAAAINEHTVDIVDAIYHEFV